MDTQQSNHDDEDGTIHCEQAAHKEHFVLLENQTLNQTPDQSVPIIPEPRDRLTDQRLIRSLEEAWQWCGGTKTELGSERPPTPPNGLAWLGALDTVQHRHSGFWDRKFQSGLGTFERRDGGMITCAHYFGYFCLDAPAGRLHALPA